MRFAVASKCVVAKLEPSNSDKDYKAAVSMIQCQVFKIEIYDKNLRSKVEFYVFFKTAGCQTRCKLKNFKS